MAIEDVAKNLVSMCREGKFNEVIDTYYADDIVSIEAMGNEQMPRVAEGIQAVRGKNQWWADNNEVHALDIMGPYFNGDQFSVHMQIETTFKPTGQRQNMSEVCLYDVKDDKIVKEQFYYDTSNMA